MNHENRKIMSVEMTDDMLKQIKLSKDIQECICNGNYFVYKLEDPLGKVYIGITKHLPHERWMNGLGYKCQNKRMTKALELNDFSKWKKEIVAANLTQEEALAKENDLILELKTYDPEYGYNVMVKRDKSDESEKLPKELQEDFEKYVTTRKESISDKLYSYYVEYLTILNPKQECKEYVLEKMKSSKYKYPQVYQFYEEWLEEQILIHDEEIQEILKLKEAYIVAYEKTLNSYREYYYFAEHSHLPWRLDTIKYLLDIQFCCWRDVILDNHGMLWHYKKFVEFVINNDCVRNDIVVQADSDILKLFNKEIFKISTCVIDMPYYPDYYTGEDTMMMPMKFRGRELGKYYIQVAYNPIEMEITGDHMNRRIIRLERHHKEFFLKLYEEILDYLEGEIPNACDDLELYLDDLHKYKGKRNHELHNECVKFLRRAKEMSYQQFEFLIDQCNFHYDDTGYSYNELSTMFEKMKTCCSYGQYRLIKHLAAEYELCLRPNAFVTKKTAGMLIDFLKDGVSSNEHEELVVKTLCLQEKKSIHDLKKLFE